MTLSGIKYYVSTHTDKAETTLVKCPVCNNYSSMRKIADNNKCLYCDNVDNFQYIQ